MTRSNPLSLAVCLALVLAASARGQNLVPNPDFDSGLDSWQSAGGSWSAAPDSGTCLLSGSAAAGPAQYLAILNAACIPVDPALTPALQAGALYWSDGDVWVRLYLHLYSTADCSMHLGWSDTLFARPESSWNGVQGELAIPAGTQAVELWIDFNPAIADPPPFNATLDRVWLGTAPRVFTDGFEAEGGTACNWTGVQP